MALTPENTGMLIVLKVPSACKALWRPNCKLCSKFRDGFVLYVQYSTVQVQYCMKKAGLKNTILVMRGKNTRGPPGR